ncbi:MAG: MFS transporter [Acidimicrobiales bacterium]
MSVVHPWSNETYPPKRASHPSACHARPRSARLRRPVLPPRPHGRTHLPRHFSTGRFGFLWGASAASSIGDGLALVAFPLLATTMTRSPALIAGVAVATRLPWLLLSLPAGALADRVDRRRLLMVVEVSRMLVLLVLGGLIVSGRASLVAVYVSAFTLGAFQILYVGATQAVLPTMVRSDRLSKANSHLFIAQTSGEQFLGPAIGGLAFAAMASLPFLADGATFAISGALLALAFPRRDHRRVRPATDSKASIGREMRQGLVWFAGHRVLRLVGAMVGTFAFCQSMGAAILVVFGLRVLHLSGSGFGIFVAVAAVGNLLGAAAVPHLVHRIGTARALLSAGMVAGVAYAVMGTAGSVPIALAALTCEAFAVGVGMVASAVLRQTLIPTELAGRVNVVMRSCAYGAATLGALTGGTLAAIGGARLPFILGGTAEFVGALAIGLPLARILTVARAGDDQLEIDIEAWISSPADQVRSPAYVVDDVA